MPKRERKRREKGARYFQTLAAFNELGDRFEKVAFPDVPYPAAPIWHFTTESGLAGILKSKVLWARHSEHTNDSSEMTYANAPIVEELQKLFDETGLGIYHGFLENYEHASITSQAQIYVASFCKSADDAQTWRNYGDGGKGAAIAFVGEKLPALPFSSRGAAAGLAPLEYNPKRQREITKSQAKQIVEAGVEFVRAHPGMDRPAGLRGTAALLWIAARHCVMFKHPSFVTENEWRWFYLVMRGTLGPTLPVTTRNGVPYVDLPLAEAGAPPPIAEIELGPLTTIDRAAVERLLRESWIRQRGTDAIDNQSHCPDEALMRTPERLAPGELTSV